jgi:exosortase/archaeosortase
LPFGLSLASVAIRSLWSDPIPRASSTICCLYCHVRVICLGARRNSLPTTSFLLSMSFLSFFVFEQFSTTSPPAAAHQQVHLLPRAVAHMTVICTTAAPI